MFDFWTVLYLIIVGLVAGYLARLLLTRTGGMGFWMTLLVGVVGSFVGGVLGYLLFGFDEDEGWLQPGGIIGSIVGAVIVLAIYRAYVEKQRRTAPGGSPGP